MTEIDAIDTGRCGRRCGRKRNSGTERCTRWRSNAPRLTSDVSLATLSVLVLCTCEAVLAML